MYTESQIGELFDAEVLAYVVNKNRGGISNNKGNTYENFFAVYQIALLSQDVIEYNKEIRLFSQILAFVDDLIIDCQEDTSLCHYQLKNTASRAWGTGIKSIADDFKKQHQLNQSVSRESEINLVVSSQELKTNLDSSIPTAISTYTQVFYFPSEPSLVKVIEKEDTFQRAIVYLCAFNNPAPDKIECVATVLLGAWASSNKSSVSMLEILKKAQESTPSFIRSFNQERRLDLEVERILNAVEDFTYNLAKGFLHWEFKDGLFEGTLPYSLESERFKRFEELIKRNIPTCFEELEVFLI